MTRRRPLPRTEICGDCRAPVTIGRPVYGEGREVTFPKLNKNGSPHVCGPQNVGGMEPLPLSTSSGPTIPPDPWCEPWRRRGSED